MLFSLIIGLCTVGCTSNKKEGTEIPSEWVTEKEETVELGSVKPPMFCEDFATLASDGKYSSVVWGEGIDAQNIMWSESGYPGFGYPMVVEVLTEPVLEDVSLTTSWGEYTYSPVRGGHAFREDNNLVDIDSGKLLVRWATAEERLVLWCKSSGSYVIYSYNGGTKIVE